MARQEVSYFGVYLPQQVRRPLSRHLQGAKAQGAIRELLLLGGETGLGKTALAKAISTDLGLPFRKLIASVRTTAAELEEFLDDCAAAGALAFVDETQELRSDVQMAFVSRVDRFLEDASAPGWKGAFSIVLATDRVQYLERPLRNRFPYQVTLLPYAMRYMKKIVAARAAAVQMVMTPQAQEMLSSVSRGSPRLAGQLIDRLKTFWAVAPPPEITKRHLQRFLDVQGIDLHGLLPQDRRYLELLRAAPEGLTLRVLAIRSALDPRYVTEVVEPHLIRLGLVTVRQGLRCLIAPALKSKEKES